jgi:hypothetical protein
MSFFGRPMTYQNRTWFAAGVGPVQEQLVINNTAGSKNIVETLELESFSKG